MTQSQQENINMTHKKEIIRWSNRIKPEPVYEWQWYTNTGGGEFFLSKEFSTKPLDGYCYQGEWYKFKPSKRIKNEQ